MCNVDNYIILKKEAYRVVSLVTIYMDISSIVESAKAQKLAESKEWGSKARKVDARNKKRLRNRIKSFLKMLVF